MKKTFATLALCLVAAFGFSQQATFLRNAKDQANKIGMNYTVYTKGNASLGAFIGTNTSTFTNTGRNQKADLAFGPTATYNFYKYKGWGFGATVGYIGSTQKVAFPGHNQWMFGVSLTHKF
jgi:hypothetical protein